MSNPSGPKLNELCISKSSTYAKREESGSRLDRLVRNNVARIKKKKKGEHTVEMKGAWAM